MLIFAIFTIGFFIGVFITLWIFPPNTSEIREQEIDALQPILDLEKKKYQEVTEKRGIHTQPSITS